MDFTTFALKLSPYWLVVLSAQRISSITASKNCSLCHILVGKKITVKMSIVKPPWISIYLSTQMNTHGEIQKNSHHYNLRFPANSSWQRPPKSQVTLAVIANVACMSELHLCVSYAVGQQHTTVDTGTYMPWHRSADSDGWMHTGAI